jgi:hypothetical protein
VPFRSAFSAPIQGCKRVLADRSVGLLRYAPRGGSTHADAPSLLAFLQRQPSGAHDDRVRRLVTLRAAAAIGAVALMVSCSAQASHEVTKPEISPANGGIPPNITITPGSQISPVNMPRMQPGLPAAIRLVTSDKHRFLALPSGRIEPVGQQHGNGQMLPPAGAFWVDSRRTWVRVAGGRVEFGQGRTVVWRSRGTYNIATANALWSDAYSPAGAAFQIGRRGPLYVAPSGGAERRVALGESADGWTRSGTLLTFGKEADGFAMRLRAANGSLVRTLATGLTPTEIDAMTDVGNNVLYLAHGTIWSTDGLHVRALASLSSLGFTSQPPSLYGIGGGLVEVLGRNWHDVILRRDGSVFAEPTPPPATGYASFGVNVANSSGTTVAYEIVRVSSSRATVYLLRAGETRGTPVLHVPHANPCDFPFSWHGSWLLYRSLNGSSYAIPSDGRRPLKLLRQINGERVSSARWA